MTDYYVSSVDGNDADDGLTWANAKATVTGALVPKAAGDRIFVDSAHSEAPSAAITWAGLLSGADIMILVVDRTGDPEPPLESDIITTPTVTIDTGTTTTNNLAVQGNLIVSGFIFKTFGTIYINFASFTSRMLCNCCTFWLAGTVTSKSVYLGVNSGGANSVIRFVDCTVKMSAAGHTITVSSAGRARLEWVGGSVDTSVAVPTNLINASMHARLIGVDLSGISTGYFAGAQTTADLELVGCKIHASYTLESDTNADQELRMTSCGTGDQYTDSRLSTGYGRYETEYGIFLNAVDNAGNGVSHNVMCNATSSNGGRSFRYCLTTISEVDFTTDKTFTVEFARDGSATAYQNDELWIEVEYNDITDNALRRTDATSRCGLLDTPANLTSSSASWTGLGGTNNKMKVAVTIDSTVAATGPVRIFVCFGDSTARTDLYADPAVTVS